MNSTCASFESSIVFRRSGHPYFPLRANPKQQISGKTVKKPQRHEGAQRYKPLQRRRSRLAGRWSWFEIPMSGATTERFACKLAHRERLTKSHSFSATNLI